MGDINTWKFATVGKFFQQVKHLKIKDEELGIAVETLKRLKNIVQTNDENWINESVHDVIDSIEKGFKNDGMLDDGGDTLME